METIQFRNLALFSSPDIQQAALAKIKGTPLSIAEADALTEALAMLEAVELDGIFNVGNRYVDHGAARPGVLRQPPN